MTGRGFTLALRQSNTQNDGIKAFAYIRGMKVEKNPGGSKPSRGNLSGLYSTGLFVRADCVPAPARVPGRVVLLGHRGCDMTDDFLDDTEDNEDESQDSEDESQDTDDAASGDSGSEESSAAKRIRDLQSKADKAEARANKAEKALAKAKTSSAKVNGTADGDVPPEVAEWLKSTQVKFREDLFKEDTRFSQFKLDPALITGETPSEMRESQKALSEFVDKMEGQIRDSVLIEHGFKPEPRASERQKPVNYATMTSEEFAKHEAAALSGGMLRRSGA
jgi:hypothetical protein